MTHEGAAPRVASAPQQQSPPAQGKSQAQQPVAAGAPASQGSIFSKSEREAAPGGERAATGPGTGSNGQ
jgi:hypothetical protein